MYRRMSSSSSSGPSTGGATKKKKNTAPWLSAQSTKSFYVNAATTAATSNAIAASALSMMSQKETILPSNKRLPLRDTSNTINTDPVLHKSFSTSAPSSAEFTPGLSGYRTLQSSFAQAASAGVGNIEEDSQATRLNTIDDSAQRPELFSRVGDNLSTHEAEEEEDDDVASFHHTPDGSTVPCSYDPRQSYLPNSNLTASGEPQRDEVSQLNAGPPEWDALSPDVVIKCCKAVSAETLRSNGVRDFYKSYPSWAKMTQDQKNKTVALVL
jgi:hypothetical protein